MARELNFNNIKRHYWRVVLSDDEQTKLDIKLAEKSTVVKLMDIYKDIDDLKNITVEELQDRDILDDLYNICAILLSRNKQGRIFTKEEVAAMWDVEEIIIFCHGYTQFIEDEVKRKN